LAIQASLGGGPVSAAATSIAQSVAGQSIGIMSATDDVGA